MEKDSLKGSWGFLGLFLRLTDTFRTIVVYLRTLIWNRS